MYTWTLKIGKATVTVDDEGNWQIVEGHESLLELLNGIERGVTKPGGLPEGSRYVQAAIDRFGAELVGVDPPMEHDPGMVY